MADSKKYDGSTWQHSLRKLTTATEAVENPLYSDGTAITSYTIKGNEEHTGTPSPSNPVDVNGVGVRTENLFDEVYPNISGTVQYIPLNVGEGTFILSSDAPLNRSNGRDLFFLAGNVSSGANSGTNGVSSNQSKIQTAVDGYVTIGYRKLDGDSPDVRNYHTMLNTGSTAKPYEPYGYKIPISSGVTTNIYLGSTSSTRQIRKRVYTGDEDWGKSQSTGTFYTNPSDINANYKVAYCDKFVYNGDTIGDFGSFYTPATPLPQFNFVWDNTKTVDEWKAFLAQNPVTVWYVLAYQQTGTVNEPLMKIGDYADTLSNATAIPTTEGANSISVDTTVQPSEFTATWTGWHDATVKEWDGSQWNE